MLQNFYVFIDGFRVIDIIDLCTPGLETKRTFC